MLTIAVEGTEASGKTTFIRKLRWALAKKRMFQGASVMVYSEINDTVFSEEVKDILRNADSISTEAQLEAIDKARQDIQARIRKDKEGVQPIPFTILDRYILTTCAYQLYADPLKKHRKKVADTGNEVPKPDVTGMMEKWLSEMIEGNRFVMPNLIVLLDPGVEVCVSRIKRDDSNGLYEDDIEFLHDTADGLRLAGDVLMKVCKRFNMRAPTLIALSQDATDENIESVIQTFLTAGL